MKFPDTRWSLVLQAAQEGEPAAEDALSQLFRAYWYPLFAHLRGKGYPLHEAEELLQAFFVHMLEKQAVVRADRLKGSFRAFMIGCLRNFLAGQRELASADKRGGRARVVSFDAVEAEGRMIADTRADHAADVEREFDRRWAVLVMERAHASVKAAYAARVEVFEALKGFLVASDDTRYAEVAASLGLSVPLVKTTVHRMRRQLRDALHREIAVTVSSPHEVEAELRYLIHVLTHD